MFERDVILFLMGTSLLLKNHTKTRQFIVQLLSFPATSNESNHTK